MLTPDFKARVRLIVQEAYNVRFASNKVLKQLFPKADLRKTLHWGRIVEHCIAKMEEEEVKELSKKDQLMSAISLMKCYPGKVDTFLGVSVRVHYNKMMIGTCGWCDVAQSWVASPGSYNSRNYRVETAKDGIIMLLERTGIFLQAA